MVCCARTTLPRACRDRDGRARAGASPSPPPTTLITSNIISNPQTHTTHQHRGRHSAERRRQQGQPARLVHERRGQGRPSHIDGPDGRGRQGAVRDAGLGKDGRRKVDDRVDARKLLQGEEGAPRDHAPRGGELLGGHAGGRGGAFRAGRDRQLGRAGRAPQPLGCGIGRRARAPGRQPARGFGGQRHAGRQQRRGHGRHPEHEAPGRGGQGDVGEEGAQDADADDELVDGAQCAAHAGGGDLGYVEGDQGGRQADAQAGQGAACEEGGQAGRGRAGDGAQGERERSRDQAAPAAERVRGGRPRQRARGRAREQGGHDQALLGRIARKAQGGRHRVQGPIDDGQVVPKCKSAQRRNCDGRQDRGQGSCGGGRRGDRDLAGRARRGGGGGVHPDVQPGALAGQGRGGGVQGGGGVEEVA